MVWEGFSKKTPGDKEENDKSGVKKLTFGVLMVQGIATSIDALSVGFTTAEYSFPAALLSSFIDHRRIDFGYLLRRTCFR